MSFEERAAFSVAAADTLEERLENASGSAAGASSPAARERLRRWSGILARDGEDRLRLRLSLDSLDPRRVEEALGDAAPAREAPLSEWARVVEEALAVATASSSDPSPEAAADDPECPFAELLLPFVRVARLRLRRVAVADGLLAPAARAGLERALLRRLGRFCDELLHGERAALVAVDPARGGAWAAWMLREGWRELLHRFPVLARLVGTAVERWVEGCAEMLARLRDDHRALAERLAAGGALGPVVAIRWGLSDPHGRGRTVGMLEFACGARVAYKPRGLGIDEAWRRFLEWVNDRSPGLALRTGWTLDRGEYGWAGWVDPAPCRPGEGRARRDERLGALLCLAYAFGGGDLHPDNLLECGEDPVLVDAEVLLGAPLAHPVGDAATARAVWNSVLRTHLPAAWRPAGDRDGPEPAALVAGFEQTYRLLVAHRDEILAPDGPLEWFAGLSTRLVLRDTRRYARLLQHLLHPAFLRSGVDRSLELERLAPYLLDSADPAALWPLFRAEVRDLEGADIPVFRVQSDGTEVTGSRGEALGHLRAEPGITLAARRLRALDEDDLDVQAGIVRAALAPRAPRHVPDCCTVLSVAELVEEADAIARDLRGLARERGAGGVGWIGPTGEGERLGWVDASLADGRAGIALFLAAHARATGSAESRELALRAIPPGELAGAALRSPAASRPLDPKVPAVLLALAAEGAALGTAGTGATVAAVERLRDAPLERTDRLLDGAMSSVEILLAAAERFGRDDLREAARVRAAAVVRRARRRRSFATGIADLLAPGLLRGTAGIGYGLLRLAFPQRFPCVLLLP